MYTYYRYPLKQWPPANSNYRNGLLNNGLTGTCDQIIYFPCPLIIKKKNNDNNIFMR